MAAKTMPVRASEELHARPVERDRRARDPHHGVAGEAGHRGERRALVRRLDGPAGVGALLHRRQLDRPVRPRRRRRLARAGREPQRPRLRARRPCRAEQARLERRVLDEDASSCRRSSSRRSARSTTSPSCGSSPRIFAPGSAASPVTSRCRTRSSGRITATPGTQFPVEAYLALVREKMGESHVPEHAHRALQKAPEPEPDARGRREGLSGEAASAPAPGPPLRPGRDRRHLRPGDEEGGREGAEGARPERERHRRRHDLARADRVGDEDLGLLRLLGLGGSSAPLLWSIRRAQRSLKPARKETIA